MIFGFTFKRDNGSKFGIATAASEHEARERIAAEIGISTEKVAIISAEEALSQFDEVALLSPADEF